MASKGGSAGKTLAKGGDRAWAAISPADLAINPRVCPHFGGES